jgi:Ca2+-binding EF-hand superfamily protein
LVIVQSFLGKESVTFPEFVKMLAAQNAKHVNIEREILNAFALQDRSRKGYISRGEFEHLLVKGGEQMTKHEGLYPPPPTSNLCITLR